MARAPAIGIDLGTTNSCVAVFQHGKVEILPNDQGNRTTPSCVAFTHSQRLIGESAKSQITRNPANTIVEVKRMMGRSCNDVSVLRGKRHWPYEVVDKSGRPNVRVEHMGATKTFAPEEISSMVIAKMKKTAESCLGVSVCDAVVSVPACFNRFQRNATMDACAIAGLNVLHSIKGPDAAALTYQVERNISGERNVLIFDLGGGKLDVSIFTFEDGILEAKSTSGTVFLGGEDFTTRMVDHFIGEFKVRHKRDISGNKKAIRRLRNACEKAKIELSSNSGARIEIDSLYEGIDFYTKITRVKFEELNAEIFRSILEPVEKALLDAKFDKTQIHDIVLVGGSSRIPKIQELLQGFFDGKKLIKSLNPDEAVAYGAAVQAAILSGDRSEEVQDMLLLPITSFSLGIETGGGVMTSVIRRNSTIPKKESFSIQCPGDNHSVTVRIFEGERAMVKDNNFLDEVHLKLTPRPKEAGDHQIEIVFDVWRSEKLDVSIRDRITGEEKTITVTSSKNRLSADDIDRMKEEAENSKCKGIAASTGPPGEEDVSHPLGVGSLIQLPGTDGCSVYYGTIKWIGLVPNAQGKIAGIELEEPLDGCTDGTFQATGQKFFNCPCGKGLYYPLQNIKPDQRCQHDTPVDLSVHSEPPPDEGSQDEISCANRDQLGDDPRPQDSERASEGAEMLGLKDLLNLKLIHDCNELQAKTVILQADKDGLVKEKNELLDQVGKLTETSQVRESEVQKLKKALEASRARVQELTDQARDVEATIQAQEVEIERKATVIASKDETIREKEDEIAELQNQLDVERQKAIFNQPSNRSWKVSRSEIQRIPKRQIGFGAWGAVYSAKFQGKDVAIKIAHHQILHHTTIDMLKREVTIMSHLQHPNLVRFIAAVWDDAVERQQDMPIIVSELMEMNLRAAYERKIDLSNSMVSIFRDVAYALHYLHQHREPIIHRDISAPNVLLKSLPGGSYRAKVSDFGSANLVKQSKTAGAGAIVYCAPEMFPNEDISVPPQPQTTKVDVFSYGILLLEVISKEMPTQETRYALLQKLKKKWDVMYALLVHCTKPSPSDRPAMADILNQLNSMPN